MAPRTSRPTNTRGAAIRPRPNDNDTCSGRYGGDLFPQLGVLLLVRGPRFLARQLFERLAVRRVDDHAAGFKLLPGAFLAVDAFGDFPDRVLRFAADVQQQFLL